MFGFGSFGTGRLHFFNSTFTVYWTWTLYFLSVKKEHLRNLIFSINYKHGKWTYTVYTYKKNLIFILFLWLWPVLWQFGPGRKRAAVSGSTTLIRIYILLRVAKGTFHAILKDLSLTGLWIWICIDPHSLFSSGSVFYIFPDSDPGGEIYNNNKTKKMQGIWFLIIKILFKKFHGFFTFEQCFLVFSTTASSS